MIEAIFLEILIASALENSGDLFPVPDECDHKFFSNDLRRAVAVVHCAPVLHKVRELYGPVVAEIDLKATR